MKSLNQFRRYVVLAGVAACLSLNAIHVFAEDNLPSQLSVQFGALIPAQTTGNAISNPLVTGSPITDQGTSTGKVSVHYGYQLGKLFEVGGGIGMADYSHHYSGDFGVDSIQSRLREISADAIFPIPVHTGRIHPYAMTGLGALRFSPTSNVNNAIGSSAQTKYAFIYAGGADFEITKRIGIRAEYEESRFSLPDFQLAALHTTALTHNSEPSIGVYFKFPNLSKTTK